MPQSKASASRIAFTTRSDNGTKLVIRNAYDTTDPLHVTRAIHTRIEWEYARHMLMRLLNGSDKGYIRPRITSYTCKSRALTT